MNTESCPIQAARVLEQLKDFQRCTAEYAFRRMYLDENPTHKFLIADEVGLGKTLVAKGLVARVVEHLWPTEIERIDVVYICSNADIARQNIARLDITGTKRDSSSTRITLLATRLKNLHETRLNFVSFTPGTSFDLKSSMGIAEERVLLFWILKAHWPVKEETLLKVLSGDVEYERFGRRVYEFPNHNTIEPALAQKFITASDRLEFADGRKSSSAQEMCRQVASLLERSDKRLRLPSETRRIRSELIGRLRLTLARASLDFLSPDLIILDEFQRFKTLLDGQSEIGQLAHALFQYQDTHSAARVVLLSATPYKMYTMNGEAEDDHYQDFVRTFNFLNQDKNRQESFKQLLEEYRTALFQLPASLARVRELKSALELELRQVMVRTERLACTQDRDGMLKTIAPESLELRSTDLKTYLAMQQIAREIDESDTLEYWKSAPYLLNFMDDYSFKKNFERASEDAETAGTIAGLVRANKQVFLSWNDVREYKKLDPNNARLRNLMSQTVGKGHWQLLWLPPTLGYYSLGPEFENARRQGISKQLIFSSWVVVPKVIAVMLSYEAERELLLANEAQPERYTELHRRARLLRFDLREGRTIGMPVLGMLYPCMWLADICDPLHLGRTGLKTYNQALNWAADKIRPILDSLRVRSQPTGAEDERWYWITPFLLDLQHYGPFAENWLNRSELASIWEGDDNLDPEDSSTGWEAHIREMQKIIPAVRSGQATLGRRPSDLAEVMALISLAGPGVITLRALGRVTGGRNGMRNPDVRDSAARAARGFIRLFNLPEVTTFLQQDTNKEPYWRQVMRYSVQGGLQAVMDEYVHLLREALGLQDNTIAESAEEISDTVASALAIRSAPMGMDDVRFDSTARVPQLTPFEKRRMRARFALRFGNERTEDEESAVRKEQIRDAFNSPFWPFVLATTSVGQEGLDFHLYCHSVVHWNLPSNPVDLEQREGRVHRYKGYAVRKNVVEQFAPQALADTLGDPWATIFELAENASGENSSHIIPYWVYPGSAKIERHVPALPLSRDMLRYEALRHSLTLYRMVFGQNRQEDLMAYLIQLPLAERTQIVQELQMNLAPTCNGE